MLETTETLVDKENRLYYEDMFGFIGSLLLSVGFSEAALRKFTTLYMHEFGEYLHTSDNILDNAFQTLRSDDEIIEFFKAYSAQLGSERTARFNISFALRSYQTSNTSSSLERRWTRVLSTLESWQSVLQA